MKSHSLIVPVLGLSSLISAAPPGLALEACDTTTRTARVTQVAAGRYKRDGRIAMLQLYEKYGVPVPAKIRAAAAAALQTGHVAADPQGDDSSYLCPVMIGALQKTYMMDFDTGSADLWVFSKALPPNETGSHQLYGLGGALETGESWDIGYVSGQSAAGTVYADTVVVGGVTATSQAVEAATSVSASFVNSTLDGIVGLGFKVDNTCRPTQCNPLMHTLSTTLPEFLFTATLKHAQPGEYDFGKYTGTLTTVPVDTTNGYWEFAAAGYGVGTNGRQSLAFNAVADSGTSVLSVPNATCQAYWGEVQGAIWDHYIDAWIFPCAVSSLPALHLWWGGSAHTMPGRYANYSVLTDYWCYGGIQAITTLPFGIIGDSFLKSQFVVFNLTVPQSLGWAQQA